MVLFKQSQHLVLISMKRSLKQTEEKNTAAKRRAGSRREQSWQKDKLLYSSWISSSNILPDNCNSELGHTALSTKPCLAQIKFNNETLGISSLPCLITSFIKFNKTSTQTCYYHTLTEVSCSNLLSRAAQVEVPKKAQQMF